MFDWSFASDSCGGDCSRFNMHQFQRDLRKLLLLFLLCFHTNKASSTKLTGHSNSPSTIQVLVLDTFLHCQNLSGSKCQVVGRKTLPVGQPRVGSGKRCAGCTGDSRNISRSRPVLCFIQSSGCGIVVFGFWRWFYVMMSVLKSFWSPFLADWKKKFEG